MLTYPRFLIETGTDEFNKIPLFSIRVDKEPTITQSDTIKET